MSARNVKIEEIGNGYLVTTDSGGGIADREAFPDLKRVFERLLSYFEGRFAEGYNERFGRVVVERDREG